MKDRTKLQFVGRFCFVLGGENMKVFGELHDNMSCAEKVQGVNTYRNYNGWFDAIWKVCDFSSKQVEMLLAGNVVCVENESCFAAYQLDQLGNLNCTVVKVSETVGMRINRLTGEKEVLWRVKQPESVPAG